MEEQKLLKRRQKAKGNNGSLVSACTDLAAYYTSVQKYSKAIKEYEVLCNIYKEENNLVLYAQANRGIGEAYMELQEFEKALKYFKIHLDVSVQAKHALEQQRALAQLGHMYLTWYLETSSENKKGLLIEAYGWFMKSLKKCDSLPDNVEKQDMLARLFSNLGLVKDSLGDYDTSLNLHDKSIKICLNYDLYEQLYRGYLSMASLFEKQKIYQETVKYYNLAVEIAKKLSSKKVELICAALLAKSETLIKIGDFHGAKQVLRKAYKFKTPNQGEKKVIERHLRIVAGMCKVEDDIIACSDQKELKNLYEKMGDGSCDLKLFTKALEYYQKMLATAEKNGASDKELGQCYYSLGETYKDNGQFEEAEMYLEKEYNLCKNNLKDSLNTLCKIADIKEMAGNNVDEIKTIYERGLDSCKQKRNVKEEKILIVRYMDFLKRFSRLSDARKFEQRLNNLNEIIKDDDGSNSSSDYESEDSAKVHVGDDIVLSDVTDVSEESDNEVPETNTVQSSRRRKQNNVKFKKNLNGEWPLHVACIKGNLKMVQYWLEVDHPVNVRDNAGWLPLHEAAVHGHLEIVELLLDHKATINDRGGSECNGITPLHDAASNGHLEVLELLLDRGASAVAKTDDGNTPLFELKRWNEKTCLGLTGERQCLYDQLLKRLEEALERAGQQDGDKNRYRLFDSESPEKETRYSDTSAFGRSRRSVCLDEDAPKSDEDSTDSYHNLSQSSRRSEQSASNEYQLVMQTLRHKNYDAQKQTPSPVKSNVKRSALIDAEGYVDEDSWLEEDIRPTKSKKRRTDDSDKLWSRSRSFGERNSANSTRSSGSSVRREDASLQDEATGQAENFFIDDFDENIFETTPKQQRVSTGSNESSHSSVSRKRTQVTLLDAGFSRKKNSNSPRFNLSLKRHSSESYPSSSQSKITSFGTSTHTLVEADSTTLPQTQNTSQTELTQTITDPTLFVDVAIESRLFRVPVLLSQIQNKSIKWLADEAAHRYARKEYIRPTLELETTNGAVLADEDLLSLLFPMGSTQAEKVVAKVVEWSLPPLIERYRETCTHMNVDIDTDLHQLIQTLTVNLDLSDRGTLSEALCPLVKAISHQKTLTEINLSGNFINTTCMSMLCSSLVTLLNLQVLNLSCTCLQNAHLGLLTNTLTNNDTMFGKLTHFDVSDNIGLNQSCLQYLSTITKTLNLKTLNLSNINLSQVATDEAVLCLKTLQRLDISSNNLEDADVRKIVSWTDGAVLKELNVSNNKGNGVLNQIVEVFDSQNSLVLEKIGLQRCGGNDSNLFELLRLAPNLKSVDLCYNPDITSISLRRLLEYGNLTSLNLLCCNNIWKYFELNETGWSIDLNTRESEAVFKISGGSDIFRDCIVDMFRDKYPMCKVASSYDFLSVILNAS